MGFLDWFRGKQEEGKITLKFDDIDSYIIRNVNLKTASNKAIEQAYNRISLELEDIKHNLNDLSVADVKDKVPDKARVKVLANRDAYVKVMQAFLQTIHLPDVINEEIALNFANDLNSSLDNFSKTTKKNFYIVEQLLGVELDKVTQNLRVVSATIDTLKNELEKEDSIILKNLRQRISILRDKKSKFSDISKKVEELESTLSPFIKSRQAIEEDIARMKSSKDYEILANLNKEKDSIEKKMKDLEQNFLQSFSQVSKIIKKYNKERKIKLLESYLEIPFDTLLKDSSMEILNHLKEMQNLSDELQLKGKTKEKILASMSKINHQYLSSILQKHQDLRSQLVGVKSKIFSSRLTEEEHRLASKIESINSEIKTFEADLQQLRKINEKIDLDEDKRVIANLLAKLTNKEFELILD